MTEQVHEDSPFSTVFQQLLDLNEDFIEAVVERQSKENLRKSVKYHELLHQNLMELATFVDKMTISDDKVGSRYIMIDILFISLLIVNGSTLSKGFNRNCVEIS